MKGLLVPVASETTSPADFLVHLGKALLEKEGVDAGLVDILATHLLTATPAVDAVTRTKAAILKIAAERASSPQPENNGG